MRLKPRVASLEAKLAPQIARWVRIFQYEGQTQDQAVAAYEVEHGPIDDSKVILRVIVSKPFPAPGAAALTIRSPSPS